MTTTMTEADHEFLRAETTYLESVGVKAEAHFIDLERLGGAARVVIAGDGPPVLFVPGVMTTGVTLAGLVAGLGDYRCIMVERAGTGLSPAFADPPTTLEAHRRVADDFLVDIMDGLNVDRAHVVCTSMGGWATFRGAAAHPDRFLRISALAFQIGAGLGKVPWSMRMPLMKALVPRSVKATRGLVRGSLKSAGMRATIDNGKFSDELLDYMAATMRHTETFRNETVYSPRAVTPRGANPQVRHSAELLAKITAPVHLLWGADDFFGGAESAREFAAMIPDAELQLVEGAGHAIWLDEPELTRTAVRAHLGR